MTNRPPKLPSVFVVLAFFVGSVFPAISAVKLAVWGTQDQRDATACLIAELSQTPDDYTVIEREQLVSGVYSGT